MGCGKQVGQFFTGGISEMGKEDPQDLMGQGLMRADNYRGDVAAAEYAQLINAYQNNVQPQFNVDRDYLPQYNALALDNTRTASTGLRDIRNQEMAMEMAELGYAPAIRQQLMAANPESARLLALLNEQAEGDLMAGTRLTPEELRFAQQSSRAAMAARGMSGSNMAVADEILRTYDLGQNRLNQRRQFASGVVGLNNAMYQDPMLQYLSLAKGGAANRLNTAIGFQGGASALLRSQPGVGLLQDIYRENQRNNRMTSQNETQMAREFVETWRDIGGSMMGMGMGG